MNVIFVHGWSDRSKSMEKVAAGLRRAGIANLKAFYFDYRSRDDEATIADYAEGLHEWMKKCKLLKPKEESVPSSTSIQRTLHFVTHSTGALVVRRWLRQYHWARAAERVATVCYLAPANFGSPLAHKGRSFLGRLTKGIREMRDFGETGKRTLEALELASPEQWSLADYDLFGSKGTVYGKNGIRAAVITGASGYGGLRSFVNEDGTDGTIVVAGAGLSSRKYSVDFASGERYVGWVEQKKFQPDVPTLILAHPTHASILDLKKDRALAGDVARVLRSTPSSYDSMKKAFIDKTKVENRKNTAQDELRKQYQQLVFRLCDDRGDSIPDYFIEFGAWRRDRVDPNEPYPRPPLVNDRLPRRSGNEKRVSKAIQRHFGANVHTHSVDSSYRRFLVEPAEVKKLLGNDHVLSIEVSVQSGDDDIVYATHRFAGAAIYDPKATDKISFTWPDTTTLIEMKIDRYTKKITKMEQR